jgi:hypothetical protein
LIYKSIATALWLITLLTLQPILANASQSTRPTMCEWYQHVKVTAKKYNLDPNLCAALAAGESGIGKQEVRFCWVSKGKYRAPYNLCRGAFKYGDITNWKINTDIGIMLLANKLEKYKTLHAALKKYNTGDKGKKFDNYVKNIKRLTKSYKDRKIFD